MTRDTLEEVTETEELRRQSLATTTYVNVHCTYTDTAATETQQLYVLVVIVSISNVRDNNDIYVGNKQGGIKCGNRGTGFLDSKGSHR